MRLRLEGRLLLGTKAREPRRRPGGHRRVEEHGRLPGVVFNAVVVEGRRSHLAIVVVADDGVGHHEAVIVVVAEVVLPPARSERGGLILFDADHQGGPLPH